MSNWILLLFAVIFVALAPAAGCILAGIDRKISARMQGRQGPPMIRNRKLPFARMPETGSFLRSCPG